MAYMKMSERRMWNDCSGGLKIKRVIAGLMVIAPILIFYMVLYIIRLVSALAFYAGGGRWTWKWSYEYDDKKQDDH